MTEAPPAALQDAARTVDRALDAMLGAADLPDGLRDAVRYAALGGGKRLRPGLALLSCRAVGGPDEAALGAAMALELIHCFSLVHDDLPAMDDDDLRRGRPTLHRHSGEAMAILAGDVMLSLAFQVLIDGTPKQRPTAMLCRELSVATSEMIAGQVYDTLGGFPDDMSEPDRLRRIHRLKTEALIRVSCRLGALAGGADEALLDALTRYGQAIGLMFQIVDDLLDVTQSTEHLGKLAGKDEQAGKRTFPGIMGIEASKREIEELQRVSLEALKGLGPQAEPLREICQYLAIRTR